MTPLPAARTKVYVSHTMVSMFFFCDATAPMSSVECLSELSADYAEILQSYWVILRSALGEKIVRVGSGHGAMTS